MVMASLSVRRLDDKIVEQLRIRAAKHGIPMEEEVRQILTQALKTPESISQVFSKYFGKENGIDLELELESLNPRKPHDPIDFSE
jgi:plasmid stability protein